ncbi:uncharacterized protein BcabD6B2_25900 [Babesia caballi]|uniref:Uncharacterized protein n=1 Tax=Babesia caballi TaxID=5871 RepID=A0AAV4LTT6_BABCB|nr:hypothetical protein BcabD6B2_25900 [Babesia caballi]
MQTALLAHPNCSGLAHAPSSTSALTMLETEKGAAFVRAARGTVRHGLGCGHAPLYDPADVLLHLRRRLHPVPEVVLGVLDQLEEQVQHAPRVRLGDEQALQEGEGDLLLHRLVPVAEEAENEGDEGEGGDARVAQVVRHAAEEHVARLRDAAQHHLLEQQQAVGRPVAARGYLLEDDGERADEVEHVVVRQHHVERARVGHPELLHHHRHQRFVGVVDEHVRGDLQAAGLEDRDDVVGEVQRGDLDVVVQDDGVGQLEAPRRGAREQVAQLHGARRHRVAEAQVVAAEELGRPLQEGHQQRAHAVHLGVRRRQRVHQQVVVHGPVAGVLYGMLHERLARHEVDPVDPELRQLRGAAERQKVPQRHQRRRVVLHLVEQRAQNPLEADQRDSVLQHPQDDVQRLVQHEGFVARQPRHHQRPAVAEGPHWGIVALRRQSVRLHLGPQRLIRHLERAHQRAYQKGVRRVLVEALVEGRGVGFHAHEEVLEYAEIPLLTLYFANLQRGLVPREPLVQHQLPQRPHLVL